MVRVEVHDDENHVRAVGAVLGIADELVVIDAPERQGVVALQGRIGTANRVQASEKLSQRTLGGEVPRPRLVLLRVEVLLAAGFARRSFGELERWTVDAVARTERGCERRADHERRPATGL